MLSISLYQHSKQIYDLSFMDCCNGKLKFICPSPAVADESRRKLTREGHDIDVITISKFINDLLEEQFQDIKVMRKADLMLELSTVWKKKFLQDLGGESFFLAFNLLTELRSFTLDLNLIEEVLKEFDENVRAGIQIFWKYIEVREIVDEQQSYQILTDAFRETHHSIHEDQGRNTFVFLGFSHLSAAQIDLIKALAIRNDIYLPFSRNAYDKSLQSDWINWLDGRVLSLELSGFEYSKYSKPVIFFGKNRMGETLKLHEKIFKKAQNIFIAAKTPSFEQINEIPLNDAFFKSPSSLFISQKEKIFTSLYNIIYANKTNETQDILEILKGEILDSIKKNEFRRVKVLALIVRSIESWLELSEINEFITKFDLNVLEKTMALNLPRIYDCPILRGEPSAFIRGIEGLDAHDEGSETFFCANGAYGSLKGSDSYFSEDALAFLNAVGPVKRREFEFQILKSRILEILRDKKTTLVIENSLVEHDLAWSEIVNDLGDLKQLDVKGEAPVLKKVEDTLSRYIEKNNYPIVNVSATRIQTYLDCPRKYYFNYIKKEFIEPELENDLSPRSLGELEHSIIKKYMDSHSKWDEDKHQVLVELELSQYISKTHLILDEVVYERSLEELLGYTKDTILFLNDIQSTGKIKKIHFEKELEYEGRKGSVDCLIEFENHVAILDFKRSGASIPSQKDHNSFNKHQIWFYINSLKKSAKDLVLWGYINLSELKSSLLYINEDSGSILKELTGEKYKITFLKDESLDNNILEYDSFLSLTIKNINTDSSFDAMPRSLGVCTFCTYKNICVRELSCDS